MSPRHPDSLNARPDAEGAVTASRVERAAARAREAGAWAERRVPGAQVVLLAAQRERMAAAGLLAGGIAYRLFLWLLPAGAVVAAVLSFWVEADRGGIEETAREVGLGAVAARSALDAIEEGGRARWYFLVVGVPLLLWFSAGVVRALRLAFSVAWGLPPTRLRKALKAAAVFNGIIAGLIAFSFAAAWLREQAGDAGLVLTLLLLVVYMAATLGVLVLLPHGEAPPRALVPGAVLVAVGAQAIHLAVVLYLAPKLGRSSELYGTLGAATVILLWLYLVARLLVGATFLNAALWRSREAATSGRPAPSTAPATGPEPR